ncbi:MFS transporter [Arthrobacter sp. I2-34]|uniref:MFS transporter n=1 Tax=Arthrobacter hankyongi TaxID=2904801 RepID=A0ABS9L4I8_9MICC|nr:MFS transporter [Arthrobacter hankyongi]MCG2621404.1 MFS transporter [Arthrobacter hankyongi]
MATLISRRATDAESRSGRSSLMIVLSIVLLSEVASFEYNMVSPALPNIATSFGTTQPGLVFTVLLICGAMLLPILGKLGDVIGKKKVLLLGAGAMAVGTLICSIAPVYSIFLAGRGMQAFGMVGLVLTYGLIRDLLPKKWVPVAIGGIGAGVGVSGVLGPTLGGFLTQNYGYKSVFVFLTVYIIVTVLLVAVVVPETPVRARHKIDFLGALLLGGGAALLCYATVKSPYQAVSAVAGALLLVAFILVERRAAEPLMPLTLMRQRKVWATLLISSLLGFIFNSNVAIISQMAQSAPVSGVDSGLGLSPVEFSLTYALPLGLLGSASGLGAGYLAKRIGPKYPMIFSALCWFAGAMLIALGLVGSSGMLLLVAFIFGLGNGSYHASASNLVIEAVPATTQGVGASLKATSEQLFGAFGNAIIGAVVAAAIISTPGGAGPISYDMGGFHLAYGIYAAVALLAIIVTLTLRHGNKPATGGAA